MTTDKRARELLRNLEDARDHLKRLKLIIRTYLGTGAFAVALIIFGNAFIPFYEEIEWLGITLLIIWGIATLFASVGIAIMADESDWNGPWQDVKDADRKYSDYLIDKADRES